MIRRALMFIGIIVMAASYLNALNVAPTREEVTLPPGGTASGSFSVTSDFAKPAGMSVQTRYWYVTAEEEGKYKVEDWLDVSPSSFTFKPGETVNVTYNVHISTSVTGMRAIMLSFVPDTADNGLSMVVSVSLYVTVKGTEIIDWDFSNFMVKRWNGDTQLSVNVKNAGNVHVRPSGYMKVIGEKEKTLTMPLNPPVYPGRDRQVLVHGADNDIFPKPGNYKIEVHVENSGVTKVKKYKVVVKKSGEVVIKK
jgi:hypothetical protein